MQNKKQKVSPQVQMLLQAKKAKPVFENDQERLEYVRKNLEIIGKSFSFKKEELVNVEDQYVNASDGYNIPLRFYYPDLSTRNVFLFFHGGGFISGSLQSHDNLCRKIARESGWLVVSVGYRLAPEYQFPVGQNDAFGAYQWIIGKDYKRIVVGGDSAGGTFVAALVHHARAKGLRMPDMQVFVCPSLDLYNHDYESYRLYSEGYSLSKDDVTWGNKLYFERTGDSMLPLASPIFNDDFTAQPKALIITAEYDILQDEARVYADKLKKAGNDVNLIHFEGTIHDFIIYGKLFREAGEAVSIISGQLNDLQ